MALKRQGLRLYGMAMPTPVLAAVLACAIIAVTSLPSLAQDAIRVMTSQAHILRLNTAIKTVVIGNDQIADAVMQDPKTVVLTGKGYGVTNIVVMDNKGEAILDSKIIVSRNDLNTTRVYRRAKVEVLSCTPYCEKAPEQDMNNEN